MGQKLHNRIEIWKKLLLDFGKRNRLINFIEGKRNNVRITLPSFDKLWELVVINEREITFPYAKKVQINDDGEEIYETIITGDVNTSKPVGDLQKTLKSLRQKANTSIEEQGINTLYLTFGMLKWKERDDSEQVFSSPIILVPVKLLIESITSPYKLTLHEDEIVINPTLSHKLDNDFGIILPDFDSAKDSPVEYLEQLSKKVDNKGWSVEGSTHLTNLSFLKINMYKDLERNEDKLNSNPIVGALAGELKPVSVSGDLNDFDHDKQTRPIDTFQVVDADSSQQDAILLSKRGVSFVLQGPPGTGKSQTITNIIAEAIADGKKVLFVSEKMAALQVVYKRLTNVGLADFCFTLHSHKAKKKEILRELANSININHTRVREEALAQLDILEKKRNSLNEYQEQLHTPTSALNISIFTANGRLAKLKHAPDIIFSIPKVEYATNSLLNDRVYLLDELSKTIGKRSEEYENNVWRGSSIRLLTNSLRHEIDSKITATIPQLIELEHHHTLICEKLGLNIEPTILGNNTLSEIIAFIAKSPIIPIEWVSKSDIDSRINNAHIYQEHVEKIIKHTSELKGKYNDCIFDIDVKKCKDNLCSLMKQLQVRISGGDDNWLAENIDKIKSKLESITNNIDSLFDVAKTIASKLGIDTPTTINQIILFIQSTKALADIQNIRPTQTWFNNAELARVYSEIDGCKSIHDAVLEAKNAILARFDKEILEWDFYPVLQRFRGEYKSIFRIFNSQYRNDLRCLNSFMSNGEKLSYNKALDVLNLLKGFSDKQDVITEKTHQYTADYGCYYSGVNTQWDKLREYIDHFEKAICNIHMITPQLKDLIIRGQLPIEEIVQFNEQSISLDMDVVFEELNTVLKYNFDKSTEWKNIKIYATKSYSISAEFICAFQTLMNIRKETCNYNSAISDLDIAISLNTLNSDLERQKDIVCNLFKGYYEGIETDWNKLIEALKYAAELKDFIDIYNLPKTLVKDICTNSEIITYCSNEHLTLSEEQAKLRGFIMWFTSIFDGKEDFNRYNMLDLSNRMSLCKDKKHLLEEWVDYCSNKEKCDKAGLGEYVDKVESVKVDANYIVDAYLKRFYHLWLDAILPNFPAVLNFRGRIQTQTINEFCELDKGQFKIAQARVRERALSRIPDFNTITGARDEIGILKRELSKQRRLMPLRKLFMTIPNLITSLRPCFMMSPLSVSVFLEAQSYDFDLVIFDEASQVHTEDAIGAIMRGKQVIIVGDTQQLPPTSFFSTTLNDEDYDVDSDETEKDNDAGAYESILDEATAILPERSLRWHYRSRHEHLIAFSNIKIYNSQLITFPSSTESAPDCGVEYVYVKNGVYDRGGKKNNVMEAKKVAELVFEHFKKHPNRSLGVVSFSEAQQNAIDAAIRQIRLQNPRYDKFFIEDKEEPFFIKNLENVQGDERDTIIFSIGYARDSKGIMYMNFGPLSREGGYRRLNVAITRAKHNVKLVGSIVPTDIDLDKVSSEGVKMLRSYIEFAKQGIGALENELKFNYDLEFDSPFEESVYDFLQSKGYNVVTQIGCSGFRIDMAIKHPTQSGKFAIGIECDGATYHSSRTARERDRLRQSVLEDMGWTIYRIWSTDWIKDQRTEEDKLINAVEKALGNVVIEEEIVEDDGLDMELPAVEIEEIITPSEEDNNGYGFDNYIKVNPRSFMYNEHGAIRDKKDIILDVIAIEQPIHFDELCRRIAPLYGRQKVSSVLRNEVNQIFRYKLRGKIVNEDSFIRITGYENIKVRVPNPDDDYIRSIEYICAKELALAMKTIASHSFGITPDNLVVQTAREFGYKRTSENITGTLKKVYDRMLKNKEVEEIDGKVHIVS